MSSKKSRRGAEARKPAGRPAARRKSGGEPLYRSSKLWIGVVALAVLGGALWLTRSPEGAGADPEAPAAAPGAPVPLSEAPAVDEGPRATSVPDARLINVADDPRKGSPSAPVRIVEFADFQCPSCGQFFANTQGALTALYGDRLEWVFLDFPLTQVHDRAMPAAIAAACAHRQEKFWPYHDLLFRNQQRLADGALKDYAEEAGLDVAAWEACYEGEETRAQVEQDVALASELGVDATPTFFLGGERIKGNAPVTSFMEVIDPLLAQAQSAGAPAGDDAGDAAAPAPAEPGPAAETPEG